MTYGADTPLSILPWPRELRVRSMQLHLQSNTTRFESPFSRGTQTQELPGGRFRLTIALPNMQPDIARLLRAFLARLRGSAGRFYYPAEVRPELLPLPIPAAGEAEVAYTAPLTVDSDAITVDCARITVDATVRPSPWPATAAGTGSDPGVLVVDTAAPTGTLLVQAGQHVSFDDASGWRRLHLVVEDAVVRVNGSVRISVEPPLRATPAAGAPLHTINPTGVFLLRDDDQGALTRQSARTTAGIVLDAIESYPPGGTA